MCQYPRNRFSRHDQDSTRYKEVLEQANHGNDSNIKSKRQQENVFLFLFIRMV